MAEKRVLIVHDDADVAREIGRAVTLVAPEFDVATALTAPRALGMAVSDRPDVVVVEAELEGVDGYTFTRQLRSDPATQDVPVVIVALEPSESSALKARQVGASAHMPGNDSALDQVARKVCSLAGVAATPPLTASSVGDLNAIPAGQSAGGPQPVAGFAPSQPAASSAPPSTAPVGTTTPVGATAPVGGSAPGAASQPQAASSGSAVQTEPRPAQAPAPAPAAERSPSVSSGPSGFGQGAPPSDVPHVDDLLRMLLDRGGSDLHITVGSPPGLRLRGEIVPVEDLRPLTPRDTMEMILGMLSEEQRRRFETELELDFAYSIPGVSRFRCNVFQQRNSMGAVFRVIPIRIPTLDDLALPKVCRYLADRPRGLVLVTGPTGSGKSTTLAAMIDHINATRAVHIITMEDPIEFMHRNKRAYVNQREVGEDTHSFAAALKRVLRQDPDVILVGEMRDLETISAAITAAETGHLVLATLHTTGGPESVDRIIDVFPPHQQAQVRMQLSTTLEGILSQTLLRSTDGRSRVMAMEIMLGIPAISNLIREGKTHQMMTIIQGGAQLGMQTLDQHLKNLLNAGKVTFEEAVSKAKHPRELADMVGRKL